MAGMDTPLSTPCFLANSSEQRIAAAAPSLVGQHWNLVSGSKTIGAARISSRLDACRNCERSLATACLRFFTATLASCSLVVPYFCHVLAARAAEHLRRRRRLLEALRRHHDLHVLVHRMGAVAVLGAERALLHLLETEREHALVHAARDRLIRQIQRGRAGRAVVVDVVDRDAGQPELVDGALAAGRLAVDVADEGLLDRCRRARRRPSMPARPPPC